MLSRTLSVKELDKLHRRSVREELGVFLAEGKKVIAEAVAAKYTVQQLLITDKFFREQRDFLTEKSLMSFPQTMIAEHTAQRLSATTTPPGIFAVITQPKVVWEDVARQPWLIAFDNVRDPGNLGTMLRTADWFGVKAVIVSREGVDPYHDKVLRGSMGSVFHLQTYLSDDLATDLAELKAQGTKLVTTQPLPAPGLQVETTALKSPCCLIFGNESVGISGDVQKLAQGVIQIPRYGQAESLNVAVSFGIVMSQVASVLAQDALTAAVTTSSRKPPASPK